MYLAITLFVNGAREVRDTDAAYVRLHGVIDYMGAPGPYTRWDDAIPTDGSADDLTFGGSPVTVGGRNIRV